MQGGGYKNVLLTFNKAYMHVAGNLILTLNKYNEGLFFYIFVEKADEDIEKYLFSLGAKIKLYDFEMELYIGDVHWPALSALRLFAPYFIEDDIEKLLYLDTDMLCKGNIDKIFTVPSDGCTIAMGFGLYGNFFNRSILYDYYPVNLYCNSGTLVIDVKQYKKSNSYEYLLESFKKLVGKLTGPDQDFLNFHFHGKIYFLRPEFNFTIVDFYNHYNYKNMLEEAKLVHFTAKPWKIRTHYRVKKAFLKYSIDKTVKRQVRFAMLKGLLLNPIYSLLSFIYQPLKRINTIRTLKEKLLPKR